MTSVAPVDIGAEADRVAAPVLSFTAEEAELVAGVRRQSDAKAAAEILLNLDVRPKQIRGRCCLFVGCAQTTYYTGYTWAGAVARLIYLRKKEAAEAAQLRPAIAASEPSIVRRETL